MRITYLPSAPRIQQTEPLQDARGRDRGICPSQVGVGVLRRVATSDKDRACEYRRVPTAKTSQSRIGEWTVREEENAYHFVSSLVLKSEPCIRSATAISEANCS